MVLKGINWVGHMFQKYEAILLEVEEVMYQDVVHYVENQVQTVGDSVKKFYSDVMEDLLPPPSEDPFEDVDSDLSVQKYADVVDTKEKPLNVKADRVMEIPKVIDMEVENRSSSFYGLSSVNSSSADYFNRSLYEDASMHENQEALSDEMAGSVSGFDEIEDESKYESDVSAESNDITSSHKRVSVVRSLIKGDGQYCDTGISCKEADKVIVSDSGHGDANNEIGIQIQQCDRLKLEETCVMVTGDELHFPPPRKGKSKPSKKKIREALSLRRKPARAGEYEQLAMWYEGDGRTESLKRGVSMEDKGGSETSHICESEWEFL